MTSAVIIGAGLSGIASAARLARGARGRGVVGGLRPFRPNPRVRRHLLRARRRRGPTLSR